MANDELEDILAGYQPASSKQPKKATDKLSYHAQKSGVDENLIRVMMGQESGGDGKAKSWTGNAGKLQVSQDVVNRFVKRDEFGTLDPYNEDVNFAAGTRYMRWLLDRYKGDHKRALAGYNAGEANADKPDWYEKSRFWSNDPDVQAGRKPRGDSDKTNTRRYIDKISAKANLGGASSSSIDDILGSYPAGETESIDDVLQSYQPAAPVAGEEPQEGQQQTAPPTPINNVSDVERQLVKDSTDQTLPAPMREKARQSLEIFRRNNTPLAPVTPPPIAADSAPKADNPFKIANDGFKPAEDQSNVSAGQTRYTDAGGTPFIVAPDGTAKAENPEKLPLLFESGDQKFLQSSNQDGLKLGEIRVRSLRNDKGGHHIATKQKNGQYSIRPENEPQTVADAPKVLRRPSKAVNRQTQGGNNQPVSANGSTNAAQPAQPEQIAVQNSGNDLQTALDAADAAAGVAREISLKDGTKLNLSADKRGLQEGEQAYTDKDGKRFVYNPVEESVKPAPDVYTVDFAGKGKNETEQQFARRNVAEKIAQKYKINLGDADRVLAEALGEASSEIKEGLRGRSDQLYDFTVAPEIIEKAKARRGAIQKSVLEAYAKTGEISEENRNYLQSEGISQKDIDNLINADTPEALEARTKGESAKKLYTQKLSEYAANPETESKAQILASFDAGFISRAQADELLAAQTEVEQRFRTEAENNSGKDFGFDPSTSASYRPRNKQEIDADVSERLSQMRKEFGSAKNMLAAEKRDQAEVNDYWKTAHPFGQSSEAIKTAARYIAKLPATIIDAVGMSADLNPVTAALDYVTGTDSKPGLQPIFDAAESWRKMIDNDPVLKQNKVFKKDFIVNEVSEAVAQFVTQMVAAPLTGGYSLALPIAEASTAQYKEADKAGAGRATRLLAATVGAAAGVPDVLLQAKYLRFLSPAEKSGFISNLTRSLIAKYTEKFGEKEGAELARISVISYLKKAGTGFIFEGGQEYFEDVINDTVAKFTYKPELTAKDILVPTKEKLRGYAAAGISGAVGGAVEAKTEALTNGGENISLVEPDENDLAETVKNENNPIIAVKPLTETSEKTENVREPVREPVREKIEAGAKISAQIGSGAKAKTKTGTVKEIKGNQVIVDFDDNSRSAIPIKKANVIETAENVSESEALPEPVEQTKAEKQQPVTAQGLAFGKRAETVATNDAAQAESAPAPVDAAQSAPQIPLKANVFTSERGKKIKFETVENFVIKNGSQVSLPQIQREFGVSFKDANKIAEKIKQTIGDNAIKQTSAKNPFVPKDVQAAPENVQAQAENPEKREQSDVQAGEQPNQEQNAAETGDAKIIASPVQKNAADVRAAGKQTVDGVDYVRQPELSETDAPIGKTGTVEFAAGREVPFKYRLVEADSLQPSHLGGNRNYNHFIPEAQPKNISGKDRMQASDDIAKNPDLEKASVSPNAYFGAPVVNARGEAVQGNNRSESFKKHYKMGGKSYRQQLAAKAAELGFSTQQVERMKQPVLVRQIDSTDDQAIELGNYSAQDLETGGKRRLDPVALAARIPMTEKAGLIDKIFNTDGDFTLNELVRDRQAQIFKALENHITPTQIATMRDKTGALNPDGIKDISDLVKQFLLAGGDVRLPVLFDELPHKLQQSIPASLPKIFNVPAEASLIAEIQNGLLAYADFKASEVESFAVWSGQTDMFSGKAPLDLYTPTELALAKLFDEGQTQKDIKNIFAAYNNLVNEQPPTLLQPSRDGLSKAAAVKELFGVEHYERENETNNQSDEKESDAEKTADENAGTKTGDAPSIGEPESQKSAADRDGETGEKLTAAEPLPESFTHAGVTVRVVPLKDLHARLAAMQDATIRQVLADPQKFVDAYYEKFGRVDINSDHAKELFPEYKADPLANVQGAHEASSMLAQLIRDMRLAELPKGSQVLLTAGGAGSGKGYVLKTNFRNGEDFALVYDSVMKSVDGNTKLIEKIIKAGHQPNIIAVFTPVETAAIQNLRRSTNPEVLRLVPVKVLATGHHGFQQAFASDDFLELLQNTKTPVTFFINDGQTKPGKISLDRFRDLIYNNVGEIERLAQEASDEELRTNPKELNYDDRAADALAGRYIEARNVRTESVQTSPPVQSDAAAGGSEPKSDRKSESVQRGNEQSAGKLAESERLDSGAPPKDKPVTLVFGGSFSPIHTEHTNVALAARKYLQDQGYTVERIVLSPSADKLLRKKLGDETVPLEARAEMARLTLADLGSDIEVATGAGEAAEKFEGKLKRTQLADWAQEKYPDSSVVNITGADQPVEGTPTDESVFPAVYQGAQGSSHAGYYYLSMPREIETPNAKSSSAIRKAVKEGKPVPEGFMTPSAEKYYLDYLNKKENSEANVESASTPTFEPKGELKRLLAIQDNFEIAAQKNGFAVIKTTGLKGNRTVIDYPVYNSDGNFSGWTFTKEQDAIAKMQQFAQAEVKSAPITKADDYGANNKVFTKDAAEKAREILRKRLGSSNKQLNTGLDPEIALAGLQIAGYHVEAGAKKFADFAAKMVDDIGTEIKPFLKSFYASVYYYPGFNNEGMDSPASLESVKVFEAIAEGQKNAANASETNSDDAAQARDYGSLDKPNVPSIGAAYADHFAGGKGFTNILDARRLAAELLGGKVESGTETAKRIDEAIEVGVVMAARKIVAENRSTAETFQNLLDLYERQPNLSVRSSTSIAQQAYSTPAPLAFVASHLAGITKNSSVYEPTAGNGMLLISAAPGNIIANELNSDRYQNLKAVLGSQATVSNFDAANTVPTGKVDVVIENPPFGVVRDDDGNSQSFQIAPGYKTNEIDHAIVFESLKTMKDDGRAVLIVGGVRGDSESARSDKYNSGAKRSFYYSLYKDYNVTDHFTVDGKLYAKQGAAYPVDVIVIEGRGKSTLDLPAANVPRIYSSYENLGELLNERANLLDAGIRGTVNTEQGSVRETNDDQNSEISDGNGQRDLSSISVGESSSIAQSGTESTQSVARTLSNARRTESGSTDIIGRLTNDGNVSDSRQFGTMGISQTERTGNAETNYAGNQFQSGENVQGSGNDSRLDGRPAVSGSDRSTRVETETVSAPKVYTEAAQVPYHPASNSYSLETLLPANMQTAVADALENLKREVGDVNKFVSEKLGYEDSTKYLSAEAHDTVALAIYNIEKGAGFIIGDQTGIGKGRMVASIIRYALRQNLTPIFVTEKPNLYADIVRDLIDTGTASIDENGLHGINPLMTNAGEKIPLDKDGNAFLQSKDSKGQAAAMQNIVDAGEMGDYDLIFTTYNQLQTVKGQRTVRHDLIEAVGENSIVIFDESHNAGGNVATNNKRNKADSTELNRATFARRMAKMAKGVVYSSATFAKRPEVMDLYFKTDISKAVKNLEELPDVINAGGVPLQQVVSSMLAQAGQYLRRERTFEGVEYATEIAQVDRKLAARVSDMMREIDNFSRVIATLTKERDKELKKEGKRLTIDGSVGSAGATSMNFTSLMHNLVSQMLLGLKAPIAANKAIDALRNGEKPVLTVASTMGSFIESYVDDFNLTSGDAIDLNFGGLLLRYLERSRDITEVDPFGAKTRRRLSDEDLGDRGVAAYKRVKELIENYDWSKIPASPIDYIKNEIQQAGYTIGEITGRKHTIDYSEEKMPRYVARAQSEIKTAGRKKAIDGFNEGSTDAIILNQAGSTGLSLHASETVKNKNRRHMIIVQPELNIDTHMQMLGRVHRTGQVITPRYTQLVADVPAEKRPAAVLAKKMASLNANTTASRDSALTAKDVPDFMNKYGDEVALMLMIDQPELHEKLGEPLGSFSSMTAVMEGAMRKVTGRIPLLPLDEQELVYEALENEYEDLINQLNALGENGLEAKTYDLDAKTLSSKTIFDSKGKSVFEEAARAEKVDMKKQGKPFSTAEVAEQIGKALGRELTAEEIKNGTYIHDGATLVRGIMDEAKSRFDSYQRDILDNIDEEDRQKYEAEKKKLEGIKASFHNALYALPIGASVKISGKDAVLRGVVTKIEQKGKPKNPLALGSWRITFAVADAARQIVLPLSKTFVMMGAVQSAQIAEAIEAGKTVIQRGEETQSTDESGKETFILDAFDQARSVSREKRTIITGNILAGYGVVKGGQIINYSDATGNLKQGILMPKNFDLDTKLKDAPVELAHAEQVLEMLDSVGANQSIVTNDGNTFRITRNYAGNYVFSTDAAKATGGKFYLNRELIRLAGRDFIKTGNSMTAQIKDRQTAQEMIRHATASLDVNWQTKTFKDKAREITGQSLPVEELAEPLLRIEDVPETDFETIKRSDPATVVSQAKIERRGDRLKLNLEAQEILRRAWEETKIRAGSLKLGGKTTESSFSGAFYEPEQTARLVETLKTVASDARAGGYQTEAKAVDNIISEIEAAQKAGQGTVVAYMFDSRLPHELFHQMSYLGSVVKALNSRHAQPKVLDAHPALVAARANYFDRLASFKKMPEGARRATIREEVAAYIAGGERELLGVSEQDAADYMVKFFDSYAAQNGIESLNNFETEELDVQTIIEQIKEAYAEENNVKHDSAVQNKETSAGGENLRAKSQENAETSKSSDEGVFGESGTRETGQKLRSLPQTFRENGLRANDEYYDSFSDADAKAEARRMLDQYGMRGAVDLLKSIPDPDASHAQLAFLINTELQERANNLESSDPIEAAALRKIQSDFTGDLARKYTRAGQFISAARTVANSATGIQISAQAILKESQGEDKSLSPEQIKHFETLGEISEHAQAQLALVKQKLRNAQAKIRRLQTEKDAAKPRRVTKSSAFGRAKVAELIKKTQQANHQILLESLRKELAASPEIAMRAEEKILRAPNGKPSNLTAFQHAQVRTPEFKKWFGDWENDPENASKVVDENGEPMIVYRISHAEQKIEINSQGEFRFFTNDAKAVNAYAIEDEPSVGIPVFLDIKNPNEMDFDGDEDNGIYEEALDAVDDGFDGLIAYGTFDGNNLIDQFVPVLRTNQIKSAIGNNGEFSPDNDSILKRAEENAHDLTDQQLAQLSEAGAYILTEGIGAKPDAYLPDHFYAEMTTLFGDAIRPAMNEIYYGALEKRSEWINNLRRDSKREAVAKKYGEQITDAEIDEILQTNSETAKRRRAVEKVHELVSGFNPRKLTDNLREAIGEVSGTPETAQAAVILAGGADKSEFYQKTERLGIARKDAEKLLVSGKEALDAAKEKIKTDNRQILEDVAAQSKLIGSIEGELWQARRAAQAAQESVAKEFKKIKDGKLLHFGKAFFGGAMDVFRNMKATGEFSFLLKQGGRYIVAEPVRAMFNGIYGGIVKNDYSIKKDFAAQGNVFASGGKSLWSEENFGRVMTGIEKNPLFNEAVKMGVQFSVAGKVGTGTKTGEEQLNSGLIEKLAEQNNRWILPAVAKLIGRFDASMAGTLDALRMMMYDRMATQLRKEGLTPEKNKPEFVAIARDITRSTGRANKFERAKGLQKIVDAVSASHLPFATAYTVSHFQMIGADAKNIASAAANLVTLKGLPKGAQKAMLARAAYSYGSMTVFYTVLAYALGGLVSFDPDDDDFLKLKVGDLRYDATFGLRGELRFIVRMMKDAYEGNRVPNEFLYDAINNTWKYSRNKLNVIPGFAVDALTGKDALGQPVDLRDWKTYAKLLVPITYGGIPENYSKGGIAGVASTLPTEFIGIGTNLYPDRADEAKTEAEKLALKIKQMKKPWFSPNTYADQTSRKTWDQISKLKERARSGEDVSAEAKAMLDDGIINEKIFKSIVEAKSKTLFEDLVEDARPDEAQIAALEKVANPEEKEVLNKIATGKKENSAEKTKRDAKRDAINQTILEIQKLPAGERGAAINRRLDELTRQGVIDKDDYGKIRSGVAKGKTQPILEMDGARDADKVIGIFDKYYKDADDAERKKLLQYLREKRDNSKKGETRNKYTNALYRYQMDNKPNNAMVNGGQSNNVIDMRKNFLRRPSAAR